MTNTTNTTKQYKGETFNFGTAAGLSQYIKAAGTDARSADEALAKAAPYALAYTTGEKGSNLDPICQLYAALAVKSALQSANQKRLVTFVGMYAPHLRFDSETADKKPFKFKTTGRDKKTGKPKYIPVAKRVLAETFEFSLDYRLCEKAPAEKDNKPKPVTVKSLKAFTDKTLAAFADKAAAMSAGIEQIDAPEEAKEEATVDYHAALLDMVFKAVPLELIAARLESEMSTATDDNSPAVELSSTEQAAAIVRGDSDESEATA